MSVNSINNSIKFPGLANGQPNRFMIMPTEKQEVATTPQIPQKQEVQAGMMEAQNVKSKGMSDKTKYLIGATALAASAIAGIMLYKARPQDLQKISANSDNSSNVITNIVKHVKDNYLVPIKDVDDLDYSNKRVHTLMKKVGLDDKGEAIYKNRGISVIDSINSPSGIVQKSVIADDGTEFARFSYGEDGNVFQYFMKDRDGRIVREYINGVTTKFIYTKDNVKIKLQYDGSGWTKQEKFDAKGKLIEKEELFPELKK